MKARYLTFFSYIGTKFRGCEKICPKDGRNNRDPHSIQGIMEIALKKLKPVNYPNLVLSSRTDGGVHALNSSAHVDLIKQGDGEDIFDTNFITYEMNKFFFMNEISIFVRKCVRVNDNFNARFDATSRTYLYRLALLKPDIEVEENGSGLGTLIPIEEWKRCHFIRLKNFDVERFKDGAKYFVGYHDFTTFKKFDKRMQHIQNRRKVISIVVKPGKSCVINSCSKQNNYFDYWDIEIVGRGFVHNQIRRMIGTLITVAMGKLESKDIKVMLQVPSKHSWHTFIEKSPPYGLYLASVHYNPEDLIYNPNKDSASEKEINESNLHSESE